MRSKYGLWLLTLPALSGCSDSSSLSEARDEPPALDISAPVYRSLPCEFKPKKLERVAAATAAAPARTTGILATIDPALTHQAVDHVATYETRQSFEPFQGHRVVIRRRSGLSRIETYRTKPSRQGYPSRATDFYNLPAQARVGLRYADDGTLDSVTLDRRHQWQNQFTISRTAKRESIAGESCSVLMISYEMPASPDRKWTRSICVTPDGVVLHNTGYFPTGEKTDELRAIDVKRGSVQRSDVLPPRQMLDWNAWATRSREPSGAKSAMSLNYELTLARERAGEDLGDPTETIAETHLADGAGVLVARCSRAGFDNAKLTLARGGSVVWGEDMLRLQRTDESLLESHSPKPVALRQRSGLVQGKRCYWFDTFAGADDATRIECRTRDGVPLRIEATNWTMPRNWIATQFSKGTVKPGSNLPPPQLLDWAYWGWPELSLAKPESSVQGPRQSRG